MYNDFIRILLCVFAVYGVYALLRELRIFLPHKDRFVIAARLADAADPELQSERIAAAVCAAGRLSDAERRPILLLEDYAQTKTVAGQSYEMYVKVTDTEEACRRKLKTE